MTAFRLLGTPAESAGPEAIVVTTFWTTDHESLREAETMSPSVRRVLEARVPGSVSVMQEVDTPVRANRAAAAAQLISRGYAMGPP